MTTELVATVQSYWEAGEGTATREEMEASVTKFVANFPDSEWSKIAGLNWCHAGGPNTKSEGGMSQPMIDAIIAAKLDKKPYKKP